MLSLRLRPLIAHVVDPLAARLLKAGLTPDTITVAGTVGTVLAAVLLLGTGRFLAGGLVVTVFVLSDTLDGTMARLRGTTSSFGAWLDSTCDRAADAAVFGSLAYWYTGPGNSRVVAAVCVYVLSTSLVVSYAKARAEGLGMTANIGIAERAERLVVVLAGSLAVGFGAPIAVLSIALVLLAVLTTVTVGQRAAEVHRQAALRT